MKMDRDRVISVSLSEDEWRAFVARHPQPVSWLRDRIIGELKDGGASGGPNRRTETASVRPSRPQS